MKNLVPSVLIIYKMETVSSVTGQCVISHSLLANIDPDAITHPGLRIGWEELLREPVEQYAGLIEQRGLSRVGRTANGSVATVRDLLH